MTVEQCHKCSYYNRNIHHVLSFINEWCDISKAHNKYLLTDKKCPYFKDWTK